MITKVLEQDLRAEGIDEITLMNGWILQYLYENQGNDIYQKDIEKFFSIGRSTVTNIIQLMEKRDLIQREPVKHDARLKKVILTEKGIKSHERTKELIFELNHEIAAGISEEELEAFLKVMDKIEKNVNKKCNIDKKEGENR